ncbi:metallo-beta-lactamase domain-containing protein 1-like [Lineus longissimus]|uniref:metallo-beta-lactamase domain-containing protein 1-like n=1 Tax=Lineus longissimus TaxID=88925 RepID=UPI002B4E8124
MATYQIKVLKEGYCKPVDNSNSVFKADGSITLIKGRNHNVMVDTGCPTDRDCILKGLKENSLTPDQIDYVVCTHGHVDHVGNLNLFQNATHIVGYDICKGDQYMMHDFKGGIPFEIDDVIEVHPTPGHTMSDVSVLVKGTEKGTVVISGDLFEMEEDLEDSDIWQNQSENAELQQQNRIEMLRLADVIIPGHGPAFQVKHEYKRQCSFTMMGNNDEEEM